MSDAEKWETEGMRAAINRSAATHSMYIFGPEEARAAWLKGWQFAHDELEFQYQRGLEDAPRVAAFREEMAEDVPRLSYDFSTLEERRAAIDNRRQLAVRRL